MHNKTMTWMLALTLFAGGGLAACGSDSDGSAATDAPTIRAAMAAGALSYLVKPFAMTELIARTRARSCRRLPAETTHVPLGKVCSPRRRSTTATSSGSAHTGPHSPPPA